MGSGLRSGPEFQTGGPSAVQSFSNSPATFVRHQVVSLLCGTNQDRSEKVPVLRGDAGPSAPREQEASRTARSGTSSTNSPNKVTACLFALFLGFFGAHKFYLGEIMWGVFYVVMNVLLFWTVVVPVVFGMICLIEGLTYLTLSDADFAEKYGQ